MFHFGGIGIQTGTQKIDEIVNDLCLLCAHYFHSLLATIKNKRPDLLSNLQTDTPPINEEMPQKVLDKWNFGINEFEIK